MRSKFYALILSSVLIVLVGSAFISIDEKKKVASAAATITVEELKDHMYFLASDELTGRRSGTDGYDIAAQYAATQFRAAGLKPLVKDAEGNDSFLQKFDLVSIKQGKGNTLAIRKDDVVVSFEHSDDYILFRPGKDFDREYEPLEVVFLGYGIEEPDYGFNDYEGIDVAGKIAVVMLGAPLKEGKAVLPQKLHARYVPQMGALLKYETARKHGAAGFIVVPYPQMFAGWKLLVKQLGNMSIITLPDSGKRGKDSAMNPEVPVLIANKTMIETLFSREAYNPATAEGEYGSFHLQGVDLSLKVNMERELLPTANVVAVVPGTDPVLKDEFITIGAHLDHDGIRDGKIYNGADDNASGSVAVLEAAEALAVSPARRSVVFILYAAEELGLLGSTYYVNNSPVPLENTILNINMDMVGRDDDQIPGGMYAIGSDKRSTELKDLLIRTNESTVNLNLDFRFDENDPERWFYRSDQLEFHNKGIPVVFFTSGDHPDYHKPTDDAEKINYEKIMSVSRLVYELAMTVGNRDERLRIDIVEQQ